MPAVLLRNRLRDFWRNTWQATAGSSWQSLSHIVRFFTPFTDWIGDLKNPKVVRTDLLAGIMVATVLIPQALAYAQLAGLPAYRGLYAAFVPVIFAAILGSSRHLSTGPVAIVSLLAAGSLQTSLWYEPTNLTAALVVLALMVGLLQLILGLLRLGMFVNFLSLPVILGFMNAAALVIILSQIEKVFGLSVAPSDQFLVEAWQTLRQVFSHAQGETIGMAIIAFVLLTVPRVFNERFPRMASAIVVTTLLSWWLDYEGRGGAVLGALPAGLPEFELPIIVWSDLGHLAPIAVAIALIGFVDTDIISKALATRTRQRLDTNQELVGQGAANIAAGLFQGYPVAGSHSRSTLNYAWGARTGLSKIVAGVLVGVTLLFFTPLLYHLPQATLGALIIVVMFGIFQIKPVIDAFKVQVHDGIVVLTTFVLTLLMAPRIENAVLIGVLLSLGLYLYRTMRPRVIILSRHPDGTLRDAELFDLDICPSISVSRFDGSLYFANTGFFEDKILDRVAAKPDLKYVILDGEGINEIDASGVEILHTLVQRLQAIGIQLAIAKTKGQILNTLRRAGLANELGEDLIFRIRNQAIMHAWEHIDQCPREGCNQSCPLRANF